MSLLTDINWLPKYDSDNRSLVNDFYIPVLNCAIRYHRTTGYFTAKVLTLASRGIEGLIRNNGQMRLIIGCTLAEAEIEAISQGENLRSVIEQHYTTNPLICQDSTEIDALELLSWAIAFGYLEVKVAIPCSSNRQPILSQGIFHEKAGIIEDKAGNRLAFNGSLNETEAGWRYNWESFHVFTDWSGTKTYVDAEENSFAKLWANQAKHCLVIDVPTALKNKLLAYLPPSDQKPKRLQTHKIIHNIPTVKHNTVHELPNQPTPYQVAWSIIENAASLKDVGDYIGLATCIVKPWPHQLKTFQRLYYNWPPKLLIADEVGLGKTIEAGLLLRQAWLSKKAKRILILAPKAVLKQWQIELKEKFNLNWPIYDGKTLTWYESPALKVLNLPISQPVSREEWHQQPCLITSSQLMRRRDRVTELLEQAAAYDLIILDEAHHARSSLSNNQNSKPNQLLRLMQQLKHKTQGLILLTATPMQVHPFEVWDLLNLLGLPPEWDSHSFIEFFNYAKHHNPSHAQFEFMAKLFRSVEAKYGETPLETAIKYTPDNSKLAAKKILAALRDEAQLPRKQLSTNHRRAAIQIMRVSTPVNKLISRHTRELLRKYYEAGKISTPIATRIVTDEFVQLSYQEKQVYQDLEKYIFTTYNKASKQEKNAVGFVMTIYRRRLASSFAALEKTLTKRIEGYKMMLTDEDLTDDYSTDEIIDLDQATILEQKALQLEEYHQLQLLLQQVKQLPTDSKTNVLLKLIQQLSQEYKQIIIFTQYTDTMDYLRLLLKSNIGLKILCFSGRGGEIPTNNLSWQQISRDETKRIFKDGAADILLCTDAAAEGLNFQFCGALINYDMPWNPMRVEQRIGRIDRLGQQYAKIKIINLHYQNTIETDVYLALRDRIDLFSQYVGKLQPILANLPKNITNVILSSPQQRDKQKADLINDVEETIRQTELDGFNIDIITQDDLEDPTITPPLYDLSSLDYILQNPDLLPPAVEATMLQPLEYKYSMPGMTQPLRITTNPEYYDLHSGSTELWSPGSVLFPTPENTPPLTKPVFLKDM